MKKLISNNKVHEEKVRESYEKKFRKMLGSIKKIVRFLFSPFIDLITFRFEIVEPTVTPEEARQLAELIEVWASQWGE